AVQPLPPTGIVVMVHHCSGTNEMPHPPSETGSSSLLTPKPLYVRYAMPPFVTSGEGVKALHALQKLVPAPSDIPDATSYLMVMVSALRMPPKSPVPWIFNCMSNSSEEAPWTNLASTDEGKISIW